ncbi:MAG: hypothetical protein KAS07_03280 [Candidatus Pacebacteria bacterium]|nr:hypothetical protein [Candidatus Paceibacterota bacterium]
MKKEFFGRIIYDIALLASILFFPWWIIVMVVCVGVILYEQYIECVIAGVVIDMLYGTYLFPVIFTLSFFCIYAIFGKLKKYVRIYG